MFEISTTPSFNTDKLVYGDEYDYVTRTSFNQGVLRKTGYVNQENINEKGTWSLGLLQMDFFYRKNPWYAGQFVRKIVPKISLGHNSTLYFTAILNKQKQKLLSVLVRDVDSTFLNGTIYLPTKDGKIDFEFMESFISELEEERISELEEERISELSAYLRVSGLDNYELSSEEKEALDKFEFLQWKEFKIGDLFDVNSSKKIFHASNIEVFDEQVLDSYPYVVRKTGENGIKGYIKESEEFLNPSNTLSFAQDTFTVFYQKNKYFTGNKVKVLVPKFKIFNEVISEFFVAVFNNLLSNLSWGDGSNVEMIKSFVIQLPTKDNKIDFSYMELLISAVQKLAIKDVVIYADSKIEATKTIINSKNR